MVYVTQNDPKVWKQAINIVSNVPKILGTDDVRVELVAQEPGLGILTPARTDKDRVTSMIQYAAKFSACGTTMGNIKTEKGKEPV